MFESDDRNRGSIRCSYPSRGFCNALTDARVQIPSGVHGFADPLKELGEARRRRPPPFRERHESTSPCRRFDPSRKQSRRFEFLSRSDCRPRSSNCAGRRAPSSLRRKRPRSHQSAAERERYCTFVFTRTGEVPSVGNAFALQPVQCLVSEGGSHLKTRHGRSCGRATPRAHTRTAGRRTSQPRRPAA